MTYDTAHPLTLKQNHGFTLGFRILQIVAYVCFLWLWATVLEYTPRAIDTAILLFSAPPALLMFWRKPEYGLIALMFFGSGFIPPALVDVRLSQLGGFELRDLLLFTMLGISGIKSLLYKEFRIAWWPVGGLLLAFLMMVFFSLIHALFLEGVPGNWAFSDARILFFYLTFFITTWCITSKDTLLTLVIGCFVIADITAAIVLVQQQLGAYNFVLSSMSDGSWQIAEQAGSVRVVPPGIVFMYFMLLISIGLSFFWKLSCLSKSFLFLHTAFLGLGLIFTFTRSAWVATAIALLMLALVSFPDYKPYFFHSLIVIVASIFFVVGAFGLIRDRLSLDNVTFLGIFDRFVSIFTVEDTLETNSLQWRYFEIQEASKAIEESPLIGMGLGNSYRNLTAFQGEARGLWTDGDLSYVRIDRFTRYVHSSYFAIAVKMGIPALILLMGFFFSAIVKSISLHHALPNSLAKGVALPISAGMVGLLQWSFLHAHLILASSTLVIGLMIGLLATVHHIYIHQPQHPVVRRILD
jgi:hypothetical protein